MLCDHKTGRVTSLSSQFFAHIAGRRILVEGNPALKPIAGCLNIGATIKPCTGTLRQLEGSSTLVFIDGKPTCLETVTGTTDGTPPAVVKFEVATPGQAFVDASE